MVKLLRDCGAISGIGCTPETYLLSEEAIAQLPKKDCNEEDGSAQFYQYRGGSAFIKSYQGAMKGLKDEVTKNQTYVDGYYNKDRIGLPYDWSRLTINLTTTNETPSMESSSDSPSFPAEENEEEEQDDDRDASEEEKEKRKIAKSFCDTKPGANHASLNVYVTSSTGGGGAGISDWCADINIHERTGRPEDLIDLLFDCQPAQLDFQFIAPSLSTYLAEKIASNGSLQVIGLDETRHEGTVQAISKILQSESQNPTLLRLYGYNEPSYDLLLSSLEDGFCSNASIRTLDLASRDMSKDGFAPFVASAIKNLKNLNDLDLSSTKGFAIGDNDDDDDKPKPSPTSLHPIIDAFSHSQTLTTVNLRGCSVPEEVVDQLVGGICTSSSLTSLNLRGTNTGTKALAALGEKLQKEGCALKALDLTLIGSSVKTDIDLSSIINALPLNTTLTTLKIGGNQQPAGGMKELAEALSRNTSLANLHLDTVYSIDDGFKAFFSMLARMKGLLLLDISDNAMTDEALEILLEKLDTSNELSIKQIEAIDMQASEILLERLSKAAANGTITTSVSKLEEWDATDSIILVSDDSCGIQLPPRRYGDGARHVGTAAFLADFLNDVLVSYANEKEEKDPSRLPFFLSPLESSTHGAHVGWTEYSEWASSSANFPLTSHAGKAEEIAKLIASLGVSNFCLSGNLPGTLLNAFEQEPLTGACKSLTFKGMILTKEATALLVKVLSSSETLEHMELIDIEEDEGNSSTVVAKIPEGTLRALKTLKVENVPLTNPVNMIVKEILLAGSALEKVVFKSIPNDSQSSQGVFIMGPGESLPTGALKELKILMIEDVKFMNPLGPLIEEILSSSSCNLELIELHGIGFNDLECVNMICKGFEKNLSLRTVKFKSGDKEILPDDVQAALLSGISGLRGLEDCDLKLEVCDTETLTALAHFIKTSKCPKCSILFGYECGPVNISPVALALEDNTSLVELSIEPSQHLFLDVGVKNLGQALVKNTTLEALRTVASNLSFKGAVDFYSLIGSMKGLKRLEFATSDCSDARNSKELSNEALDAFVGGLKENTSIQELSADYPYNYAAEVTAGTIKLIQMSAPPNLTSVSVHLMGNDDDFPKGVPDLLAGIASNNTLSKLSLSIDYELPWGDLGKALLQNSKLETLVIDYCEYWGPKKEDMEEFIKSICQTRSLKEIQFKQKLEVEVKEVLVECAKQTSINFLFA